MNSNWSLIRTIHSNIIGIPPHIVDLIAVEDILYLYATGVGVSDISVMLDLDDPYVADTLSSYYINFSRVETLNYNPMKYYREAFRDLDQYLTICFTFGSEDELVESYLVCKFYEQYKKEMDKYERN